MLEGAGQVVEVIPSVRVERQAALVDAAVGFLDPACRKKSECHKIASFILMVIGHFRCQCCMCVINLLSNLLPFSSV